MTSTQHDADLLVVGSDSVALLLALLAAQRFMQVTVLSDGSTPPGDEAPVLGRDALAVLERAGVADALRAATNGSGAVSEGALRSMLERSALDAGVRLVSGSLQSFDTGDSVVIALDGCDAERGMTTRWLAGTDHAVRDLLGVDVAAVGAVRVAAQLRAGPVFLLGRGAGPHRDARLIGIGDADNLAWRLQAVHQGHAHDRLLDAYDAERRAQLICTVTDRSEPQPLCVGQLAGSHPMVGSHLPDASIDGRPLDARLNHGWAILTSDVALLPDSLLCRWIGVGARIVLLGESLSAIAGAPENGAVLVRPDRIVAAVATQGDEFRMVSEQLFGWYADGEPRADSAG